MCMVLALLHMPNLTISYYVVLLKESAGARKRIIKSGLRAIQIPISVQ